MAGTLALAAQDKRIDGIFKDLGRYGAALWVIYLHFTGGLTLPRLKDVCRRSGVLSPGRARALLIYLQLLGYVKSLPKSAPGPKKYAPSAPLIAAIKAQAVLGLEALAIADPDFQIVLDHFEEPEVFQAFIVTFGEGGINASVAVDQTSAFWNTFLMRNAGTQILHILMIADQETGGKPIAISVAGMGRQLHVARSHIAHVLRLAESAKLIQRTGDGEIVLSDELRMNSEHIFALQMVGYAISAAVSIAHISANI